MDINKKILLDRGDMLPVMETFYTIQGEGFYSGTPSYFIRIAGCDIGCQWCDVKDSWDSSKHPPITIEDIISDVKKIDPEMALRAANKKFIDRFLAVETHLNESALSLENSTKDEMNAAWQKIKDRH